MSLKIADRIMETTNNAELGSIVLQGNFPGYRRFQDTFSTGDQVPYVISKSGVFEIGQGTLSSTTPWTLSRDIIYASSSNNQKINVTEGMLIFVDATKAYFDQIGIGGDVVSNTTGSTDKAIARFVGTSGQTIEDSSITIDDFGSINIPTGQTYNINGVPHSHTGDFETAGAVAAHELAYDHTDLHEHVNKTLLDNISQTDIDNWNTSGNASVADITYENLNTNGDVGMTTGQVAPGDHTHGFEDITGSIPNSTDAILDGDFLTAGFMKTDGAGTYSVNQYAIGDNAGIENTVARGDHTHSFEELAGNIPSSPNAILDEDFILPGLMTTDGAGMYSVTVIGEGAGQVAAGDHIHSFEELTGNIPASPNAILDEDFTSAGLMSTSGAGVYSTVGIGVESGQVAAGNHNHVITRLNQYGEGSGNKVTNLQTDWIPNNTTYDGVNGGYPKAADETVILYVNKLVPDSVDYWARGLRPLTMNVSTNNGTAIRAEVVVRDEVGQLIGMGNSNGSAMQMTFIDGSSQRDINVIIVTFIDGVGNPAYLTGISFNDGISIIKVPIEYNNDNWDVAYTHSQDAHAPSNAITASGVTYEALDTNGDIGMEVSKLAPGDHTHDISIDDLIGWENEDRMTIYRDPDKKDNEGIFTEVQWKRVDTTLYKKSLLTGPSPMYNVRTVTYYELDGTTVRGTVIFDITYSPAGDLMAETIRA